MSSEDRVPWEDRPEQRTLCRGCKRFTPAQELWSQEEDPYLGICLLKDSIFSVPVKFKKTCYWYKCKYLTRYERIMEMALQPVDAVKDSHEGGTVV